MTGPLPFTEVPEFDWELEALVQELTLPLPYPFISRPSR